MGVDQIGMFDTSIRTGALQVLQARGFLAGDEFGKFYVGAGNRVVLFSALTNLTVGLAPSGVYATIKLQWYPGSRYRLVGRVKNLSSGKELKLDLQCLDAEDPKFNGENPGEMFFDSTSKEIETPPASPPAFNTGGNSSESMTRLKSDYIQWKVNHKPLSPVSGLFQPVAEFVAPMDYVRVLVADITNANLVYTTGSAGTWWVCLQVGANAQ